jgi:translation initiation factor 2B subunit (eIF-2B alpha/beta/delta family)
MPAEWARLIDRIRADNTSGAAELARMAASAVLKWTEQTRSMPPQAWKKALLAFAPELYRAQPAMAPLFNLVNGMLLALESTALQEAPQPHVRAVVQTFLADLPHAQELMTTAALELIPSQARILTYSYSSSVLAVVLAAQARQRLSAVFCTEGRPMLEGQRLTQELAKAGVAVDLGVDAAITTFAEEADVALVGADSVTQGGIINKLGTTSLALACRHTGIPCYVVANRHKWFPASAVVPAFSQFKPAVEVWANPPSGVTIWNAYFECTPMSLFSGIIAETGLQGPQDLLRELLEMPIAQVLRSPGPGVH